MARVCDICGKRPIAGWNAQSIGMNRKRAARRWLPNLQAVRYEVDGKFVSGRVCSGCRRTLEKVRS